MQADSIGGLLDGFDLDHPACILGTGYRDDPEGFGRIVRDPSGQFSEIVEQKDATETQLAIQEVNLSCYVFHCQDLLSALDSLENNNAQNEYYITDCPGILLAAGKSVVALDVLKPCESLSINTMEDLATVETEMSRMGSRGT
jgi:bifunctional UDP-N-acetylglucosamine pyrophosphorylase/glucosamine-1-phosphate N-acetyltransferase/UDP-N-acetylglucosamine pyrophosphorylase